MSVLSLEACSTVPLASYLKCLGVLRLVSMQRDGEARGWWEGGLFRLDSCLDEDGLTRFFLEDYAPSPAVSPWNGGSGFYEGDRVEGRDAILESPHPRFASYRHVIQEILSWDEMPTANPTLGTLLDSCERQKLAPEDVAAARGLLAEHRELEQEVLSLALDGLEERRKQDRQNGPWLSRLAKCAKKARTALNQASRSGSKESLAGACRDRLEDRVLDWLDAVLAMLPDGSLGMPPVLGTGGNEGRLEYSNLFMRFLAQLLLPQADAASRQLLENALFGSPSRQLVMEPAGMFDPGRAGGFNQGMGIENKAFPVNPWDFVLGLEGTMAWASGVSRSQSARREGRLVSPFTVRPSAVGYSSAVEGEEAAARAELWAPVWNRPLSFPELHAFFSEGLAEVCGRRASSGLEFAEAASSLGVDRGIDHFVRFSLLKRRGDSYVALPAGRFPVRTRTGADLVRELEQRVLSRLDGALRSLKPGPPASLRVARRGIDEAIYTYLLRGQAHQLVELTAALGRLERLLARGEPLPRAPVGGLGARWLVHLEDSLEVRLAAALASIGGQSGVGPLRANLVPVDPGRPWEWARGGDQVAWRGAHLPARLASVLERRLLDAERGPLEAMPLRSRLAAHAEDIAAFLRGEVDEALLEDLLFGFGWLDWSGQNDVFDEVRRGWGRPRAEGIVTVDYILLKLLFLPRPLEHGGRTATLRKEPRVLPLLLARRLQEACEVARRRLFVSGFDPVELLRDHPATTDTARLAGSLLIPVRKLPRLCSRVLKTQEERNQTDDTRHHAMA